MNKCYINAIGKHLPGEPISNDEMEDYLGKIGGVASRTKKRVLYQNGIRQRHYAIDKHQQTTISNTRMAANAVKDALNGSSIGLDDIELLVAATSQGDTPLPGFASMVHGELESPTCEIASLHGICASSVVALRHGSAVIQSGSVKNAVTVASELPSRLLKSTRFEKQGYGAEKKLPFETEFLRWMLSDGAGAMVLSDTPNTKGLSLQVDAVHIKSYANLFAPCMFVGNKDEVTKENIFSWLDYPDYESASGAGAINLHQTVGMLDDVVRMCVNGIFELIDEGKLSTSNIDWWVSHYSSHVFKDQAVELFSRGGIQIPPERIFSNLYTRGNMGSASFYVMLEELFNSGNLEPGQTLLCIVPESGRFLFGYVTLKVVGEPIALNQRKPIQTAADIIQAPEIKTSGTTVEQSLVRQLTRVWNDFENQLIKVPIIKKINNGTLKLRDYQELLFNLRQQVIDGSRWISRTASNITREHFEIRSAFIGHSSDEHRDFEMLESDYVAIGGILEDIRNGTKNIGSEALSEYIFGRASRENPFDLIGARFIIEGLGRRVARRWALRIKEQLDLRDDQVKFLLYHSDSDDIHFQRLDLAVQSGILTDDLNNKVVKTAKVVARLYILQLEEIGNF